MGSWIERTDQYFNDLNLWNLKVDEAYVKVSSLVTDKVFFYSLSEECEKCPYSKVTKLANKTVKNVYRIDTAERQSWKFFSDNLGPYAFDNETELCKLEPIVGEFGVYDVTVTGSNTCEYTISKAPVNIYYSLIVFLVLCLALFTAGSLGKRLYQKYKSRLRSQDTVVSEDSVSDEPKTPKKRLKSLDTFRGISIVLMIFVNSGGGGYVFIEHATWNGLHIADLVFPWFLFIMGVCIPMSIKSQLNRNVTKFDLLKTVIKRSIILFAIGLSLNTINGAQLENIRIFGVLQRFGIAYLCTSTIYIALTKQISFQPQNYFRRSVHDIIVLFPQWCCIALIVLVHLLITFDLHVPGCPSGYLGPGGKHDFVAHPNCIGGATGYIDKLILGATHIYQHPTARTVYDAQPFDPEGVFGCLLTIVQVFLGVQCGTILLVHTEWCKRIFRFLIWGSVLGLVAALLCSFSKNDGIIPVNKNLWSLSYVCLTSSFAFFLLTICYFLIDVRGIWSGEPFVYPGMNAIIMYVGHTVAHKMLPWHWQIGPMNTHFMLLLESTWNTFLWILIAYYLYFKNIFFSV